MSSASKSPTDRTALPWLILAGAAAATWLWINLCRFPASPWNDLRLAPVFMAAQGVPVYTLPGEGILTTWMYGPVPLWFWWPATLARDAVSALLTAGALNLLLTVVAIGFVCRNWPAPGATTRTRVFAFALCLLLWPDHAFRFLQADNVAVALGLTSLGLLATSAGSSSPKRAWLAALTTAAALGSKQTALGLLAAQVLWLYGAQGLRPALAHTGRTVVAGGALLSFSLWQFGARELWFGAVAVPRNLPFADDSLARALESFPHLFFPVLVPTAVLILLGRFTLWLKPGQPLQLAALAWVCSLPLGIFAYMTMGGSTNSIHGLHYLLPALALALITARPRGRSLPPAALAAGTVLVAVLRIGQAEFAPVRPALRTVQEAQTLQAADHGQTWLPWNPLVTYFATGRFDHAEDGIYVRFITGHPVSLQQARAGVPPDMKTIAFPSPEMQWGIAAKLGPADARATRQGAWLVLTWP